MMTHNQKVRLARRLRSRAETRRHTPIVLTNAWEESKDVMAGRIRA